MDNKQKNIKKIKLSFLINCFNLGGAQKLIYTIVKELVSENYDISIIGIKDIGPYYQKFKDLDINTYSLRVKNNYDIGSFIRLFRLIKKIDPDILHTNLFYSHIMGRLISVFFKFKVISTIHNTLHYSNFKKYLLKFTDYLSTYNIVVCDKVKEVLIKSNISKKDKIITIHNGIDISMFNTNLSNNYRKISLEKLILDKKEIRLITIGRLEKPKGYLNLLKAMNILKEKGYNFKLLIVGEGSLKNKIKYTIRKHGLENYVILTGNKKDIKELLNVSDLFVISSLWEGLPLVILEAMAASLPVIATDVGGINEVINDKYNGFLVKPNDPDLFADTVIKVLNTDNKMLNLVKENARKTVISSFQIKNKVKQYKNLYESLSR